MRGIDPVICPTAHNMVSVDIELIHRHLPSVRNEAKAFPGQSGTHITVRRGIHGAFLASGSHGKCQRKALWDTLSIHQVNSDQRLSTSEEWNFRP